MPGKNERVEQVKALRALANAYGTNKPRGDAGGLRNLESMKPPPKPLKPKQIERAREYLALTADTLKQNLANDPSYIFDKKGRVKEGAVTLRELGLRHRDEVQQVATGVDSVLSSGDDRAIVNAARKFRRAHAGNKAAAFQKANDQSAAMFGGTVLGDIANALDVPGRVVRAGLVGGGELATGDFSLDDAGEQLSGEAHVGDLLADAGIDGWAGRILGFAGDVATDPLTYVMPEKAIANPERAIGALMKPEVIDNLGMDVVKEAVAQVGRRKTAQFLDPEILNEIGATGGLKLFGRGPTIVPKAVRNAVSKPFNDLRVAIGDALDRAPLGSLRGASAPMKAALRSGDTEKAWAGAVLGRVPKAQAALAQGVAKEWDQEFQQILKGVSDDHMVDLLYALEGNQSAISRISKVLPHDTLNAARGWYDKIIEAVNDAARRAGFEGRLNRLEDYVPRGLTDEMRALKRAGKRGSLGDAVESFVQKRRLGPGSVIFGETIPEGLDNAGVRQFVNDLAKEHLGTEMFSVDLKKLSSAYAQQAGREIGRFQAITEMKRLGVVGDAVEETKVPFSQQWMNAADEAVRPSLRELTPKISWRRVDNEKIEWYASAADKYRALAAKETEPTRAEVLMLGADERELRGAAEAMTGEADNAASRGFTFKATDADTITQLSKDLREGLMVRYGDRLMIDPEGKKLLDDVVRLTEPTVMKNEVLKVYDSLLNWTKAWQTTSPGFHARNLFGGVFNNALAGIDPRSYFEWLKANRAYSKGGSAWEAFQRAKPEVSEWYVESRRLAGTGQFQSEVIEFNKGGLNKYNPVSSQGPIVRFSRDKLGANTEGFLRGSLAYDTLKHGGSAEDAVAMIDKFHFDYADLSKFEKNVVKRVIPFYVWTRRNMPLQVEMLVKHPSVYSKWFAFQRNLALGTPSDQIVPQYYGENAATRTPFTEGDDRVYLMPDLPLKDLNKFDDPRDFLSQITPLIKTPIELDRGKQFFKDLPISDKEQDLPESWGFLKPALDAVGVTRTDKHGNTKISESNVYVLEQFLPMLGRFRRNAPSEKKYQDREITGLLNLMFGLGLRTNTKAEQKAEKFRRKLESGELEPVTFYQEKKK